MPSELEMLFDAADRQLDKAHAQIDAARGTVRDLRAEVDATSKVTERDAPTQGGEVDHQP